MKTKFNKYERVAGLFVLTAIGGSIVIMIGVMVQRGWLEAKIDLETTVATAEGIREGSPVQISGIRAGQVTAVELSDRRDIRVKFEISKRFEESVRSDSTVHVFRPFIIGEKVLDITQGSEGATKVTEHTVLKSENAIDVMDLMSGKTLTPYIGILTQMTENLRFVAEAFLDPTRSRAIVKMFDDLSPLVKNMTSMSREATGLILQVNKNQKLVHTVDNLVVMTDELTRLLPELRKESPELAHDLAHIAKNTAVLTDELQKTLPAFAEIGPELPRASRRAIEALDETVVTLKALQKSFLMRGNVRDVREEEAQKANARDANGQREPASQEQKGGK